MQQSALLAAGVRRHHGEQVDHSGDGGDGRAHASAKQAIKAGCYQRLVAPHEAKSVKGKTRDPESKRKKHQHRVHRVRLDVHGRTHKVLLLGHVAETPAYIRDRRMRLAGWPRGAPDRTMAAAMKPQTLLLATLLIASSSSTSVAQTVPATGRKGDRSGGVQRVIAEAQKAPTLEKNLRTLTDEVGGRVPGTRN